MRITRSEMARQWHRSTSASGPVGDEGGDPLAGKGECGAERHPPVHGRSGDARDGACHAYGSNVDGDVVNTSQPEGRSAPAPGIWRARERDDGKIGTEPCDGRPAVG